MKRSLQFLGIQAIIVFFLVIFTDWTLTPKWFLGFIWTCWSVLVAIMYAIIWREEIGCTCLEKEVNKE